MYDAKELRKIQEKKLEMFIDIVNFCDKNKITYWIDSGTLIGAVRHGGFIPWDDDIDIIIMEKDAKFLKENYKSEDFEIVDTKEDGVFLKGISKKYKVSLENQIVDLDIDLFLATEYPNSFIIRFWNSFFHLKKNRINRFSLVLFAKNILINMKRRLEKLEFFNNKSIEKRIENTLEKARKKNVPLEIVSYTPKCGFYLCLWKKEEIFPLRKLKFEGIEFQAPNNYDSYLKKMYYSYMDLPPENKRCPDHYRGKILKLIENKSEA